MKHLQGNKNIRRAAVTIILLAVTGILVLAAKLTPDIFFSFYPQFSKTVCGFLSAIFSIFPFSVYDAAVALLLLAAPVNLILAVIRKKIWKWITCAALIGASMLFIFVSFWGLNHFGPSIGEKLAAEKEQYSVEQLTQAVEFYAEKASESASVLEEDENGCTVISPFKTLANEAPAAFKTLSENGYALFSGSNLPVKPLIFGKAYSYMGLTGIFSAYTGEANVNPNTFPCSMPFTMCHEMCHRLSIAPEEEANYGAFLACMASKNPEFVYSGFYSAFIYCYNSLYDVDRDAAYSAWDMASPRLVRDLDAANAHYARYEGKVQEAADAVNDTYLKSFGEELGVQSYGAVTDFLIAWYLEQK